MRKRHATFNDVCLLKPLRLRLGREERIASVGASRKRLDSGHIGRDRCRGEAARFSKVDENAESAESVRFRVREYFRVDSYLNPATACGT